MMARPLTTSIAGMRTRCRYPLGAIRPQRASGAGGRDCTSRGPGGWPGPRWPVGVKPHHDGAGLLGCLEARRLCRNRELEFRVLTWWALAALRTFLDTLSVIVRALLRASSVRLSFAAVLEERCSLRLSALLMVSVATSLHRDWQVTLNLTLPCLPVFGSLPIFGLCFVGGGVPFGDTVSVVEAAPVTPRVSEAVTVGWNVPAARVGERGGRRGRGLLDRAVAVEVPAVARDLRVGVGERRREVHVLAGVHTRGVRAQGAARQHVARAAVDLELREVDEVVARVAELVVLRARAASAGRSARRWRSPSAGRC